MMDRDELTTLARATGKLIKDHSAEGSKDILKHVRILIDMSERKMAHELEDLRDKDRRQGETIIQLGLEIDHLKKRLAKR
jgi:hypothetical protein